MNVTLHATATTSPARDDANPALMAALAVTALAAGTLNDLTLNNAAGANLGAKGAIQVDRGMRTNLPDVSPPATARCWNPPCTATTASFA